MGSTTTGMAKGCSSNFSRGSVPGPAGLWAWNRLSAGKHPSYGLIPAPITVALAEDSGLIRPIGLWVFETACQVRKSWLDAGITDLWMAVNVSALQLERSFPKQLLDIAARYDLPPSLLEVGKLRSRARWIPISRKPYPLPVSTRGSPRQPSTISAWGTVPSST